jgi:hypothetical protein
MVDIKGAVADFVHRGGDLFERLRDGEGIDLSDVELHMLRVQLHVLEMETANLQTLRQIRSQATASSGDDATGRSA